MNRTENIHVRTSTPVRVETYNPHPPVRPAVELGDDANGTTIWFTSWQHLADFANQLLGAANIALSEERRARDEKIAEFDQDVPSAHEAEVARSWGWDV